MREEYELVMTANRDLVELLTSQLIAAFEGFVATSELGSVPNADAFMAAHNFHKWVVGRIVSESGNEMLWVAAAATFQAAMDREMRQG